jgi:hypothetical protein
LSCQSFLPTIIDIPTGHLTVLYDPEYRNLSTIKSMVFSSDSQFAVCGSDNKKLYRFKVPGERTLTEWSVLDESPLFAHNHYEDDDVTIVSGAEEVIGGHLSNVNNIVCHPDLPYVYGSGVEKAIVCHSTYSHGASQQDSPQARTPPSGLHFFSAFGSGLFLIGTRPDTEENVEEDFGTLCMFDILNEEAEDSRLFDDIEHE